MYELAIREQPKTKHQLKTHRKLNVIDAWVCRLGDGDCCWMFALVEITTNRFWCCRHVSKCRVSYFCSSLSHRLSVCMVRVQCADFFSSTETILTDSLTFIHKWTRKQFVSDYIDQNWIHGKRKCFAHTYTCGHTAHTILFMAFHQQFTLSNAFSSVNCVCKYLSNQTKDKRHKTNKNYVLISSHWTTMGLWQQLHTVICLKAW